MRSREEREARLADLRRRQLEAKSALREREREAREKPAFKRISWYLYAADRRMREERRITAFFGCKTSWVRIEAAGKYFVVNSRKSFNGRRFERPPQGGNWTFNPRGPVRAPLAH
jgi:hypothetical protein